MAKGLVSDLAVLVDTENVSHTLAGEIFERIGQLGTTSVRRAYGDWSRPQAKGWRECLELYALQPIQQFRQVAGKNAVDMRLIIHAMDLLHTEQYGGVCIVSSDSDFSSLAIRIRQQNVKAFCIGGASTAEAVRASYDGFFALSERKPTRAPAGSVPAFEEQSTSLPNKAPLTRSHLEALRSAIIAGLRKDGWADLSAVGTLLKQDGKVVTREHAANLERLVRVSGIAEFDREQGGSTVRVRLKRLA